MSETEAKPTTRARKPRATKKVAENAPVENVVVQEAAVEESQNVISSPQKAHTDGPVRSNTSTTATGVISSRAADRVFDKQEVVQEEPKTDNKVALWSDKNVRWTGIGLLSKGYNIVTKEAADKWLTRQGIRKATPEEVATHYGK